MFGKLLIKFKGDNMKEFNVLSSQLYSVSKYGVSMFGGEKVCIVAEQTVKTEDGRIVEHYLYNIVGHAPKNGQLFVSLKSNIILD
jgi:hypothetical protein